MTEVYTYEHKPIDVYINIYILIHPTQLKNQL